MDFKSINLKENEKTQYQKGQNKLFKVLRINLLNKGMTILNNETTFNRGEYESQLDVIMTIKPSKILNVSTHPNLQSDHNGVSVVRVMKIKKAEETYIM